MKFLPLVAALLALTGCRHAQEDWFYDTTPDQFIANDSLLPCPLCHARPMVRKAHRTEHFFVPPDDVTDPAWLYGVGCLTRGCLVQGTMAGYWHVEDAVAAWNERVRPWVQAPGTAANTNTIGVAHAQQ